MVRQLAKRILERALRLAWARPGRMAGRSLILAYHNVVPDQLAGRGDASLHLTQSAFHRHLELLASHCEVLPLADVLSNAPATDRPHVAITFDDAYCGAVELAIPELGRRGIPCTLFVAPGLLGEPSFWWDELAGEGSGLSSAVREQALAQEAGRQGEIRARWGRPAHGPPLPYYFGCATELQLQKLDAFESVTLGAHSWNHPDLSRVRGAELAFELEEPLRWLRAGHRRVVPVLAYPYGHSSAEVEAAAQIAGYSAGLLVEGGWQQPRTQQRWRLPRYNVPAGLTDDGLMLRLSGYFAA